MATKEQKQQLSEEREELTRQRALDTIDRYKFLLGQSELFSHFIRAKGLADAKIEAEAATAAAAKSKSKSKAAATTGRRGGRKTEKEEDAELLQDELAAEGESAGGGTSEPVVTSFTESPKYITGGTLRDYQVQGLNWMISLFEHGLNGILADEMGLGKTLQTISFLGYLKHYRDIPGRHLVLVPKSTLQNWVNEFHKWMPQNGFRVFLFQGSKDVRAELVKTHLYSTDYQATGERAAAAGDGHTPGQATQWDVCVTSYETVMLERAHFRKFPWQYIVIDEAHRIKNEQSSLSQIVRSFQCRNRLLITGTPLQNNLRELWALLNFLLPDVFTTYEEFDEYLSTNDDNEDQDHVVKQLHAVLRPFLLRRLKADVEKSLLPKRRVNLYVGMSDMQREWYQKILAKDVEAINGAVKETREGKTRLLNIVMQLRKCCNHPYLFDGAEPGPPFTTDQHLVDNAAKMKTLDNLLRTLQKQGSRVLIFSQMSRMLDILEDYCLWREYKYCRIDGNTEHEVRINSIDEYNRPGSEKFIFLLTTRAGGLGINLATADSVIMYDSDWNPQVDLQAEDRAHRIGQKKQVMVYRFVTDDAIEEKVIERAASKLRLDQLVIQQGRATAQSKALNKQELVAMIQHGAGKILSHAPKPNADGSIPNEPTLEELIKKGEERTKELEKKFDTLGLEQLQKFTVEPQSLYEFEGKDFSGAAAANVGNGLWIGLGRRERKAAVGYSVDDYYREKLSNKERQERSETTTGRVPKPPKHTYIQEHQFYPLRLVELQRRELLYFWKEISYKPKGAPEEAAAQEAEIAEASPMSEEEREEMEQLRQQGMSNWLKRDFWAFLRACERYGRDKYEDIAKEIESKTADEVKEYAEVFWQRYKELNDWETIVERIERGEERLRRRDQVQEQLTALVRSCKYPLQQLYIPYGPNQKIKNYTEEEDRFLLVGLERHGYNSDDVYEMLRREIRSYPAFRFDWFIKSRTAQELAKRCATLIRIVAKMEGDDKEGSVGLDTGKPMTAASKRKSTGAASVENLSKKVKKT